MRIPKKLKVGGVIYKIKHVNVSSVGSGPIGSFSSDCSEIEIRKGLEKQQEELTLLHELIHALFIHCDINQDEHKVELLSQALYMVIKDNPDLFKED